MKIQIILDKCWFNTVKCILEIKKKVKPTKCNSCEKGYNGTNGNGYQPCICKEK